MLAAVDGANVPVFIAENMMIETRAEGVMILAKAAGMSWSTVRAIINMRDELSGTAPTDLQTCKATLRAAAARNHPAGAAFSSHAAAELVGGGLGAGREQVPAARQALEFVRSTLGEFQAGAGDEIGDDAGN